MNLDGGVLEYWDAETGTRSDVWLAGAKGCPSAPVANGDFVEVSWRNAGLAADAILRVPWGDEAYPYFSFSEDVLWRIFKQDRDVGVSVSAVLDGLRVVTDDGEAYYRLEADGDPRLVRTGGSEQEHAAAVAAAEDTVLVTEWGYSIQFDGTDGFHYGFRVVHDEPNCPDVEGFIVAGDTGDVVACSGWMVGGALLVAPAGGPRAVKRFALPQSGCHQQDRVDDYGHYYYGFDLDALSVPSGSGRR